LLPARTPQPIVTKLHGAIVKALQAPEVIEQLKRQGLDTRGTTPDAFAAYIKSELTKWAKVVKEAGIKAD
jgi:tripartite-type tricarboxylate transporter receptor subunit TctC